MQNAIEIFQNKVVCPLCDGNGLISRIRLEPLNKIVYLCDECEATWLDQNIDVKTFVDLTTYLMRLGYGYTDVSYQDEDYYWYQQGKQI